MGLAFGELKCLQAVSSRGSFPSGTVERRYTRNPLERLNARVAVQEGVHKCRKTGSRYLR